VGFPWRSTWRSVSVPGTPACMGAGGTTASTRAAAAPLTRAVNGLPFTVVLSPPEAFSVTS
jgi:hypothetical protein